MTANPTDLFSRYFIESFDNRYNFPVPSAFQSIFGNPGSNSVTHFSEDEKLVEIDIIKNAGKKLAATVIRGQVSSPIDEDNITNYQYTNVGRQWPLVEISGNSNSSKLLDRLPGDNPYQRRTQLARNRKIAMDAFMEFVTRSIRTWEYYARQSVIEGKQASIIGTSNDMLIYNFYRSAGNTIGVPVAWDTGSADIIADIDDGCEQVEDQTGRTPDVMLAGAAAWTAFLEDTKVIATADNLRYQFVRAGKDTVVPEKYNRYIKNGWTAVGELFTYQGRSLWIFVNNESFINPTTSTKEKWMPTDKVILLSSMARFDRYFGPRDRNPVTPSEMLWFQQYFGFSMNTPPMPPMIKDIGSVVFPEAFFFDAYEGQGKKSTVYRCQSAPIFATTETDAIVVLEDLITP
ncbi:hypothetical protein AMJ80_02410 [bacterium SM23_31]|nr:MAG: hypothetical protein AMJ80_02410 [bacterium SM23_31]